VAQRTILPRICIALGFPDAEILAAHAHQEYNAGERFFEFRLDYLASPEQGAAAIRKFLARHSDCTILATCRRRQNHGRFTGSIEEQVRILEAAVDAGAQSFDIEIESAENGAPRLDALRLRSLMLLSYHNFSGTPPLDALMRRMLKIPAGGYKIVTTARKPSDSMRVLALSRAFPRTPAVLLAMGEMGFPTRVLSTAQGCLYTYAAPIAAEGTASGQICAHQLRHLYRVDKFTRDARIYGVIADPVRHSISPAVHNRAFQSRRTDAVYLPFLVKPAHLRDFLTLADKLPLAGFSVTIPHKQRIIRYLDLLDPLARRIGAVNTVWRKAGKWRGTNTDVEGVTVPLARHVRLNKASVLVAGNGGAARGAAFALAAAGALVVAGVHPYGRGCTIGLAFSVFVDHVIAASRTARRQRRCVRAPDIATVRTVKRAVSGLDRSGRGAFRAFGVRRDDQVPAFVHMALAARARAPSAVRGEFCGSVEAGRVDFADHVRGRTVSVDFTEWDDQHRCW